MAIRKFLTSVADVYAYDQSDNILFTGKTLLDSSVEVSLGSAPVRGGRGNQLQYIYYHTGEMNVTLTDTQWNLGMLASTVGSETSALNNAYSEEDVTLLTATTGAVTGGTPIAFEGSTIYGWATDSEGNTARVIFTGTNFTVVSGEEVAGWTTGTVVCVRYYNSIASTGITIPANIIPKVVKLVMEAQLNSADVSTNKIGVVQIIVPRLQLSGAFSISMTADGVSNTPLTGMALAYKPSTEEGCEVSSYYARIIEILDGANWFDNVIAFAIEGGDFSMLTTDDDITLKVWAIPSSGVPFIVPDYTDLEFTSATPATATVGLSTGVVSPVGAGTTLLTVVGAASPIDVIEASATLTVTTP
jgi:hypothetical protein